LGLFSRRGSGAGRSLRRALDTDMRALDSLASEYATATADGTFDMDAFAVRAFELAPTRDIAYLTGLGVDGHGFFERELAPNWRGQTREQRAWKIASFVRFANMLAHSQPEGAAEQLRELAATVRTKIAMLTCAYDTQYADMYRQRVARDPDSFGELKLSEELAHS
jgi:hypothetical protein